MNDAHEGVMKNVHIDETLRQRLEYCNTLPSLPTVATRIIELARDPSASMADVAEVVKADPALAVKILRMANSPLYARRRECETFQQALVMLGLNAVLTLALTFSLVSSMKDATGQGLDYDLVWRRALLAAVAARVLAEHFGSRGAEEAFLAALLQDIGMLALDRGCPDLYASLGDEQDHNTSMLLEREQLQCDHADVGAWLLNRWNIPDRLLQAVANSHANEDIPDADESIGVLCRSVRLSGPIADLWMALDPSMGLNEIQQAFNSVPGIDGVTLSVLVEKVAEAAPQIEEMFEVSLLDRKRTEWILQEAREIIVMRNLQLVQESSRLREVAANLQEQAHMLEEKSRRDNLTGAFNRGYLDNVLADWFADANNAGIPLSLAFIDLDQFKQINDSYGHQRGDEVLAASAKLLAHFARGSDLVARYGGEEFVMLLPGCTAQGAAQFCERLLDAFRAANHPLEGSNSLVVTVSIGVATHGEDIEFESCHQLLRCADQAMYRAKKLGRDRCIQHQESASAA